MGKISKADVLEPGRCSAVVMALFSRVPGVVQDPGPPVTLRLPRSNGAA
jgi:hypothetical protein